MTQDGDRPDQPQGDRESQRVKEHLRTMLRKLIANPEQPQEPKKR